MVMGRDIIQTSVEVQRIRARVRGEDPRRRDGKIANVLQRVTVGE